MANTQNLNLYKGTPGSTTETFNVETMLNENWDKVDTADAENVKKEVGKGLSTNDFTDSEKSKLGDIEDNANNYSHPSSHDVSMITNAMSATEIANAIATKLNSSSYTAADVLAKLLTVDGAGSGLDADKLDGLSATSFIRANTADNVTGHIEWQDSYSARFGNGADMRIMHNGTNNCLDIYNGEFLLRNGTTELILRAIRNAQIELYYNGIKRIETTNDGANITGNFTIDGVTQPKITVSTAQPSSPDVNDIWIDTSGV